MTTVIYTRMRRARMARRGLGKWLGSRTQTVGGEREAKMFESLVLYISDVFGVSDDHVSFKLALYQPAVAAITS